MPLPDDVVYNLLFGFRSSGSFSGESSDGVIRLSSQLRLDAQQNCGRPTLGIDAGHVDILRNEAAMQKVYDALESTNSN